MGMFHLKNTGLALFYHAQPSLPERLLRSPKEAI